MFWATVGDGGTLAAKPGQVATKGGFVRFAHVAGAGKMV
jgi:hypothetical protein